MFILLLPIFLLIFPIFVSGKISYFNKNKIINVNIKLFKFLKILALQINLNKKIIILERINKKIIKFEDLTFSKPKNTWIVNAVKGERLNFKLFINPIEYCQNIKLVNGLYIGFKSTEIISKKFFLDTSTSFQVNIDDTKIIVEFSIYTSIYLIINAFINSSENKGAKNNAKI